MKDLVMNDLRRKLQTDNLNIDDIQCMFVIYCMNILDNAFMYIVLYRDINSPSHME